MQPRYNAQAYAPTPSFLNRLIASSILLVALYFSPDIAWAQQHVVDFEGIAAGTLMDELTSTDGYAGIQLYAAHQSCPARNTAIIYNSSCPGGCTGGDDDLGTPNETFGGPGIGAGGASGMAYMNANALGNLLIVHQYCNDLDTLPVADPRDYGGSAEVTITFPTPVTFDGLTLIDIETTESLVLEYFDTSGASLGTQSAPVTGDNGVVYLEAETASYSTLSGVGQIVITKQGSGALDNLTFTPEIADLSLTAEVDNPAPETGNTVSFTLRIRNDGPDDASNVTVDYALPPGLTYAGDAPPSTSSSIRRWSAGDLAIGDSMVHTFDAVATMDTTMEVVAEVTTSSLPDPDSTPANNIPEEDDQDYAAVTPGQSSGGGDAGIESEGSMALLLARRLFHRRVDAQAARALQKAPEAVLFARTGEALAKSGTAANDLLQAIPEEGPLETRAYEVTPQDIVNFTNATSVLSVDYLQVTGRRLGAIFSAVSPSGFLYDHSKTSCDRLGGGRLEDVRTMEVNGYPFVLSKLIHPDGSADYSISFVAYRTGGNYTIDSRFAPEEYEIPADAEEITNMQIWGVAPTIAQELTQDFLDGLSEQRRIVYANTDAAAPKIFVVDGTYRQGKVTLRFVNRAGLTDIKVLGSLARTEADATSNTRSPFEQIVRLTPSTMEEPYQTTTIDVGPVFDVTLFVEHDASQSFDQVYYADGAWSYAVGPQASVDKFLVREQEQAFADYTYAVERAGSLSGDVTDWASLFKYLRPNGQAVNLSNYSHLSFMASGEGDVRLILEKKSIDTWDQYGYTFTLTPQETYYRIPFEELRQQAIDAAPFDPSDVTLIAFYALGDGIQSSEYDMKFEQLVFGGSTLDEAPDLPLGFALEQNFPNPFNPTTQITFSLEQPTRVRLAVYDMLGREVSTLIDGLQPEGQSTVTFEGANFPSGMYLYRLETPKGSTARIMSLLK